MNDNWVEINQNVMVKPKSSSMELMMVKKGRCINAFLSMENIDKLIKILNIVIEEANTKRVCIACKHYSHKYQTECCDYYLTCVVNNKCYFVPKNVIKTNTAGIKQ